MSLSGPQRRRRAVATRRVARRRLAALRCPADVSAPQAAQAALLREPEDADGLGSYGSAEIRQRADLVEALSWLDVGARSGEGDQDGSLASMTSAASLPHASDLERLSPGAPMAALLGRLTKDDGRGPTGLRSLSNFSLVEVVAAAERLASWVTAVQLQAAAVLADRQAPPATPTGMVSSSLSREGLAGRLIGARLAASPRAGEQMVRRACHLVGQLPPTLAALKSGTISFRHASLIADETMRVDGRMAVQIQEQVLARAPRLSPAKLRQAITKIIARSDPGGAEARHVAAAERRGVWSVPLPDGMAELYATLPAPDVAALMSAVDAAAVAMRAAEPHDERTMDQRRADALASVGWSALRTGCLDGEGGQRLARSRGGRTVQVAVTVAMTTLLGLDESPAELAGFGPIPASVARRLATDGTWRRLITDPVTGVPLDYGTTRYTPPPDLVEFVQIRDQTCRWPGCNQPARRCQIDHTRPAGAGGPTSHDDLGALCVPCHLAKTHAGWQLEQSAPGRFVWTDPTGHRYSVDPEPAGPVVEGGAQKPDPPPF